MLAQLSSAADTLEHIKKTNTINIAFREASLPFSYLSENKTPIGYSIDICAKFVDAIKKELKLPQLKINYIPVTSDTRMEAMTSGKADIECGSTANNAERRTKVNYTLPHFFATIRMMVFADSSIKNWQDLKDKKVVVTKGTSIAAEKVFGNVPQVAVFDTAFHAHLAPAAYTYAIPTKYTEQGIRRYGFHGISHQYCDSAAQILNGKVEDLRMITCHLGNGCSLAAIKNGQSIDTTMGFTPLEGLMMGSRSGSIDAGILIHLLRQPDMNVEKLNSL